jgi:starch phosphorylase
MEPVLDAQGNPLLIQVELNLAQVTVQAWRVNVGRCPVYLLDANRPENA